MQGADTLAVLPLPVATRPVPAPPAPRPLPPVARPADEPGLRPGVGSLERWLDLNA
jgi:hypothetical protein